MPTPVDVARQCLAKEAAAALDDAIAVAKRRNHVQTTSLHVVSALLALPSSLLRDACTRSRNVAYSQRLQFRALELCVGVALDRVSVSKNPGEEPPISNSLMAAIKRSQANQRRHPETFLLYQQQLNSNPESPPSISAVKVELKHFVMSILDDPIVSRVFGDAGFQTQEMKLMIMTPPVVSRFMSNASRPPPPFTLGDYKQSKFTSNFPFLLEDSVEKVGGNTKRISEVLSKPTRRNLLLIGACAVDAYTSFLDSVKVGEIEILPKEVKGLSLISLEHEVAEFLSGRLSEVTMRLKLKQINEKMENHQGHGIVAHCGDLITLVNAESAELVSGVISELKKSLLNSRGRLWLIGFLAGDDVYKKLVERVPKLETDWDLNLLPITSSAIGGKCSNSSLLRTFVPFGGFFSAPSELGPTKSNAEEPLELCGWCNEKYEQEVSAAHSKGEVVDSVVEIQTESPSSWLQIGKMSNSLEIKEGKSVFNAKVAALQRKWSDICRKLHFFRSSEETSPSGSNVSHLKKFPFLKDNGGVGNTSNEIACRPSDSHQNFAVQTINPKGSIQLPMPSICTARVTTDLRLGTDHRLPGEPSKKRKVREDYSGKPSGQSTLSFLSSHLDKKVLGKEFEGLWNMLAEKVYWQIDAIQTLNRAVSHWRYESNKGCLWLTFLGPDKVGKQKTAALLSDIVFGPNGNFVWLDLSMENPVYSSDSIVRHYFLKLQRMKPGRKLVVDCIADDLRKHPNSVVFLENVDKADILCQESLSLAIKNGKFQDSCGRIINIQGTIFVLESSVVKLSADEVTFGDAATEFPMEKVAEARNCPMQLSVNHSTSKDSPTANVWISSSHANKQKMVASNELNLKLSNELYRSKIDLNLPLADTEADLDTGSADCGDLHGSPNDSEPSSSSSSSSSSPWLQELTEYTEENVVFKRLDFKFAAHEVVQKINQLLQEDGVFLEINDQVMLQILAAGWLAEDKKAFILWIEQVLHLSIREAKGTCIRHSSAGHIVMRLEHHGHDCVFEQQVGGLCLPARIHIC